MRKSVIMGEEEERRRSRQVSLLYGQGLYQNWVSSCTEMFHTAHTSSIADSRDVHQAAFAVFFPGMWPHHHHTPHLQGRDTLRLDPSTLSKPVDSQKRDTHARGYTTPVSLTQWWTGRLVRRLREGDVFSPQKENADTKPFYRKCPSFCRDTESFLFPPVSVPSKR